LACSVALRLSKGLSWPTVLLFLEWGLLRPFNHLFHFVQDLPSSSCTSGCLNWSLGGLLGTTTMNFLDLADFLGPLNLEPLCVVLGSSLVILAIRWHRRFLSIGSMSIFFSLFTDSYL